MTTTSDIDWNDMREVQQELTRWASTNWPDRTYHQALSKLVLEEIPELLQHRKELGTIAIGPELADCFILLMDLATMWGVDLPTAIRAKMEINYSRMWLRDPSSGIAQHVQVKHPKVAQDMRIFEATPEARVTELMSNGEPWVRDEIITLNCLQLVGEAEGITLGNIVPWTDQECREAELWAGAIHLHASDNDDVVVPPMPQCVLLALRENASKEPL